MISAAKNYHQHNSAVIVKVVFLVSDWLGDWFHANEIGGEKRRPTVCETGHARQR